MENPEEVLQSLDEFVKLKPKDIPKELEDYLAYVAKTGDPVYQWSLVKCLFREKLINVITEFYEGCPSIELPPCPNVDSFNYEIMKNSLLERLESFVSAPFTVQRLCELLTSPKKQYSRADKFMRAVEKNILVVSTREPGNTRRADSIHTELVNGVADGLVETVHATPDSLRLAADITSIAGTTSMANAEAKCSHTVDPTNEVAQKIVPEWMNDPSLSDTSRPSVSERVAMIEKADAGASGDVGNKLAEFHSRFSQPDTESSALEEDDDEDLIPSSQDDNQYFPTDKLKTSAMVSLPDFVNLPSPDSSETSAAVSAIAEESSVDASSLDSTQEALNPPPETCQDTSAFVLSSPREETAEVSTSAAVEETAPDSSVESTTLTTESPVPDVTTTSIAVTDDVTVSESTDTDQPKSPLEEPAEAPVEVAQDAIPEVPASEPIESVVSEQSTLPVTDAEQSIPTASSEESELISPPAETVECAQDDATIAAPEVASEPEAAATTSTEDRDREMMVQNERIESVIQGTAEQDVEQTFFREAPMESLPLLNIPLEALPLEIPMEDKPLEAEPEAMEVDETSQSDEPMDQGDLSPKQS